MKISGKDWLLRRMKPGKPSRSDEKKPTASQAQEAPMGDGLARIPHDPQWTVFTVGRDASALELSGRLVSGDGGQDKSVVARVRLFDQEDRPLDHLLKGLRSSAAVGRYFYPAEYLRDGIFRFGFHIPPGVARVEAALQHWRRNDLAIYGAGALELRPVGAVANVSSRVVAASPDAAAEKLDQAEQALRAALREYAARLATDVGPLYADDAVFGEPLAEYIIHAEGMGDLAARLAGRRLRAGRDRDAIGLVGLVSEPELEKAYGRARLHDHLAARPARKAPSKQAAPRLGQGRGIVYLMHNSLPHDSGGYAARSHGLLRGFKAAGRDVHAFTRPGYPADRGHPADRRGATIDGVAYQRLAGKAAMDGPDQVAYVEQYAERVVAALKGREVGFVQAASFFRNGLAGRMVADRLGVPLVYEMRGMEWLRRGSQDQRWLESDQCRILRDLELRAASEADHVFAITDALGKWLAGEGVDAGRISVLPNGCSPDQFRPVARDPALADRLGLGGAFTVAYIGSFAAYENVPAIITAVGRAREISGKDIRLLLVGGGQAAGAVEAAIRDSGASDYVVRTGVVPHAETPDYYALSDVMVMARQDTPLTRMISPLKPLEALAMGKPVISTNVDGVREILDLAGGGRLVPANAPFGLANAIAEAASDPDALRREGETARERIIGARAWDVLARQALADLEDRFGG